MWKLFWAVSQHDKDASADTRGSQLAGTLRELGKVVPGGHSLKPPPIMRRDKANNQVNHVLGQVSLVQRLCMTESCNAFGLIDPESQRVYSACLISSSFRSHLSSSYLNILKPHSNPQSESRTRLPDLMC